MQRDPGQLSLISRDNAVDISNESPDLLLTLLLYLLKKSHPLSPRVTGQFSSASLFFAVALITPWNY